MLIRHLLLTLGSWEASIHVFFEVSLVLKSWMSLFLSRVFADRSQPSSLNFPLISTKAGSRRWESITHLQNAAFGSINSVIQFRLKNVTEPFYSVDSLVQEFQFEVKFCHCVCLSYQRFCASKTSARRCFEANTNIVMRMHQLSQRERSDA